MSLIFVDFIVFYNFRYSIEYIPAGKTLLDYTNLFSMNGYKKNDKIIHFKGKYVTRNKSGV